MSISSSIYAKHADGMRKWWASMLRQARENRDWELVDALLVEMENYTFTE